MVKDALANSGMSASKLQLEITESVLLQNTFAALATLHDLRKLGVQIALDDFGTGYSSLSYLRSFPFDKIKIDRSFIQDLSNGAEPFAIVNAVAGLAKCLNMISTAEGVETQQQLETLQAIGCTEMQGYLFSRARPANEISQFFTQRSVAITGAA
jgi:EAL domain-containing protein (putative c-di-GMP-specific phosphodiesterase class I)